MQLDSSMKDHLLLERIISLELAGVAAKGCPKSNAQKLLFWQDEADEG